MDKGLIKYYESLGEEGVLKLFSENRPGEPGSQNEQEAEAWLRLKSLQRSLESESSTRLINLQHIKLAKIAIAISIIAMILSAITTIGVVFINNHLSSSLQNPVNSNTQVQKIENPKTN